MTEPLAWMEWLVYVIAVGTAGRGVFEFAIGRTQKAVFWITAALILGAVPTVTGWALDVLDGDENPPPTPDQVSGIPWSTIGEVVAALAALAVVGGTVAAVTSATKKRRRARADGQRHREAVEARHDAVLEAYGAFSADILAVLERPRLADVSVKETAALIHALAEAGDARTATSPTATANYGRSVTALEIAWQVADEHARKAGTSRLPQDERAAIEQAGKLLRTALSDGGTDHERRLAYQRAMKLITGVVTIPRQAAEAIEQHARTSLEKKGPRT